MLLQASPFLSDPVGQSPIISAITWIEGTLMGSIATAIAVVCVATVGLMMFSGRIDVRRGLVVVLGCFVLFGASTFVAGFRGVTSSADLPLTPGTSDYTPVAQLPPGPTQTPEDPYAGASVIRR